MIYVTVDQEKCSNVNKFNQSEWIFDDFIMGKHLKYIFCDILVSYSLV